MRMTSFVCVLLLALGAASLAGADQPTAPAPAVVDDTESPEPLCGIYRTQAECIQHSQTCHWNPTLRRCLRNFE